MAALLASAGAAGGLGGRSTGRSSGEHGRRLAVPADVGEEVLWECDAIGRITYASAQCLQLTPTSPHVSHPSLASMSPNEDCRWIPSFQPTSSAVLLFVELRQIEHFLAVVEEGSFTRAAARAFLVQSSLSASLLGLERELGTDLFTRGRRGAELTDAGHAFLEPARAALAEADRARDAVAEVKGLLRGSVRIATVPAAVPRSVDLIASIRRFHQDHPQVHMQVVPTDCKSMVAMVAAGQVDFAITPRLEHASPALQFEPLVSTDLVIVCPVTHRLAGARDVPAAEVADESIVDLPCGWRSRELFDRLLTERGQPRQVRLEVADWFGVLTMVQRGLGIGYGPLACIDRATFGGVAVATLAGAPRWELGVASRDEALRGAAGRAFLARYREQSRAHDTRHGGDQDPGPAMPAGWPTRC